MSVGFTDQNALSKEKFLEWLKSLGFNIITLVVCGDSGSGGMRTHILCWFSDSLLLKGLTRTHTLMASPARFKRPLPPSHCDEKRVENVTEFEGDVGEVGEVGEVGASFIPSCGTHYVLS